MLARWDSAAAPYRFQQISSDGKSFHTQLDSNLLHENSSAAKPAASNRTNSFGSLTPDTYMHPDFVEHGFIVHAVREQYREVNAKISLYYHKIKYLRYGIRVPINSFDYKIVL